MIKWLSSHDESSPSGGVARVRVGRPDKDFWEEWKTHKEHYKTQGYDVFETKEGWFVKAPVSSIVEPPCLGHPMERPPAFLWKYQKPHFKEAWRVMGNKTSALDGSDTGCHAKGTKILLANGLLRRVEDIAVGDCVMGSDGVGKIVQSLARGFEEMYRVTPVKGESFVVNKSHILTLVRVNSSLSRKDSELNGEIIDVMVSDYLLWHKTRKHCYKLFRVGIAAWPGYEVSIPPYSMGVLLGDGHLVRKGNLSISKPDKEIEQEARRLATLFNCRIRKVLRSPRNFSYYFSQNNALWGELEKLELAGKYSVEKFIPFIYKTGDTASRFELLAGILDTDGHFTCGGYDYISASRQLSEDVAFVARSLGLAAYIKPSEKYCQNGTGGVYFRVSISGDCSQIPCRIPRKKAPKRKQIKNVLRTGFKLESVGRGEYFGFSLKGNGRFCLGDFTVTHNTGKTITTLAFALATEMPLFVVCPMSAIATWKREIKKFGNKTIAVGNYEYFKSKNDFGQMSTSYMPGKIFWAMFKKNPPFDKWAAFADYKEAMQFLCEKSVVTPKMLMEFEGKTRKSLRLLCRKIGEYKWALPKGTLFVFDEVHRCKGYGSQNMRLLIAAKPYVTLGLSATPGTNPRDMRALGYSLGLHHLYDFDLWTRDHGCRQNHWRGWDYMPASHGMEKLSKEIYPERGFRMRISEIPDFPETQITAEEFTCKEAPELQKAYAECVKALSGEVKKKSIIQITALLRYRQKAEELKIPLFISLVEEAVEGGFSVCMFVNFNLTMKKLHEHFKTAPLVYGSQHPDDRENGRLRFQNNEEKVIILNVQAGGESIDLHDTDGKYPRMSLISPTYNGFHLKQVFGRVRRGGGKSKSLQRLIYMADTVERDVCKKVREKLQAFDTLHGEMEPETLMEDKLLTVSANSLRWPEPEKETAEIAEFQTSEA